MVIQIVIASAHDSSAEPAPSTCDLTVYPKVAWPDPGVHNGFRRRGDASCMISIVGGAMCGVVGVGRCATPAEVGLRDSLSSLSRVRVLSLTVSGTLRGKMPRGDPFTWAHLSGLSLPLCRFPCTLLPCLSFASAGPFRCFLLDTSLCFSIPYSFYFFPLSQHYVGYDPPFPVAWTRNTTRSSFASSSRACLRIRFPPHFCC